MDIKQVKINLCITSTFSMFSILKLHVLFFLNREHLVAGRLFYVLIGPEKLGLSVFFRQEEQRFVLLFWGQVCTEHVQQGFCDVSIPSAFFGGGLGAVLECILHS